MATISFRTTAAVDTALADLTRDQGDRSRGIREAILTAHQSMKSERLRLEAEVLAQDGRDRAEARAILAEMAPLRVV